MHVILQSEDVATRLFSCEELCTIVNDGCGDLVVVAQLWCRSLLMWPYFMMVSGCCGVVKRWSDGGRGAQPPCRHARLPPLSSTSRGPCQGFSYITIQKKQYNIKLKILYKLSDYVLTMPYSLNYGKLYFEFFVN